jgi:predicted acetyltransferase
MSLLEIRQLGHHDEAAFLDGFKAWEGEEPDWHSFVWTKGMSHDEHLLILANEHRGINLAPNRVPHTMLYGFLDGVIVGRCSIRHELNDYLRQIGGHLGYGVAPPFRRQSFGEQLFRAGRELLKSLRTTEALMSCATDNIPSRKLIENAGGILIDEIIAPSDQRPTLRFRLPLT